MSINIFSISANNFTSTSITSSSEKTTDYLEKLLASHASSASKGVMVSGLSEVLGSM